MAEVILTSKFCRKCQKHVLTSLFAKSSKSKDRLQCWCKPCRRQYRLDNIESYKRRDRETYLKNIDYYKNLATQQRERLGKDLIKQYNQNYWQKTKKEHSAKNKIWRENNKEYVKQYSSNFYKDNKEKYYLLNKKKWIEKPHIVLEACRKRTAAKNNAVPKWADKNKILDFYKKAKDLTEYTGILHQVDHIVPIQSKLVSGLHVQQNLQVITLSQNAAKGNRWWPDMP